MTDVRTLTLPGRELADGALDRMRDLSEPAPGLAGDAVGYVKQRSTTTPLLVALASVTVVGLLVTVFVATRRRRADGDQADAGADDARRPDGEAVRAQSA